MSVCVSECVSVRASESERGREMSSRIAACGHPPVSLQSVELRFKGSGLRVPKEKYRHDAQYT